MKPTNADYLSLIQDVLPTFIEEATESLTTIEQCLLQLEEEPGERGLLDALFRCAHTVKGSAGIFGLDDIVGFTHHVETLLDLMREGSVTLTPDISTLLLQACDAIRYLVHIAAHPGDEDSEQLALREALVARLLALTHAADPQPSVVPGEVARAADAISDAAPSESAHEGLDASAALTSWRIRMAFGVNTFRDGMDPLSVLAYLGGMGILSGLDLESAAVPPLDLIDPESCYIRLSAVLQTDAPFEEIDGAFNFVRDGLEVAIELIPGPESASVAAPAALDAEHTAAAGGCAASLPSHEAESAAGLAATKLPTAKGAARASDDGRFIRVHADRLDSVINLLGELVVASAGAEMLARQTRNGQLIEANLHMAQLIGEIRDGTLQMRMVPIGETFNRFRRVVRDTAAELGKDVSFEVFGGETELDKSMVEKIVDPLMHLVRNALDHGLETSEQRLAAGKPPQGKLHLSARHEAGSMLIQIEDDGRGIQREKVLQRAWERGLLEPGTTPADADILKLIFAPGFSTAEKITNLSGRGVGMDVVRANIETLRGHVQVTSTEGQGTRIDIRLPLTLAIIDGFLVSVGSSKFIFPLESVVEVIDTVDSVLHSNDRASCMDLRGHVLPVLHLRQVYGIQGLRPQRASTVVVQSGPQRYGVAVDHLMGQHQTVIKPLGKLFRSIQCLSGSTILGNGEVALILDVHALSDLATELTAQSQAPQGTLQ